MTEIDTEPFKTAMKRYAEHVAREQESRNRLSQRQSALINTWQAVIVNVMAKVQPQLLPYGFQLHGMDIVKYHSESQNGVSLLLSRSPASGMRSRSSTFPSLIFCVFEAEHVNISADGMLTEEMPWVDVPSDLEIERVLAQYVYGALMPPAPADGQ